MSRRGDCPLVELKYMVLFSAKRTPIFEVTANSRRESLLATSALNPVTPDSEEAPSPSLRAATVPLPSDVPDSVEKATARSSVEPVPSEPSPRAVSAASDLGQGSGCVSKLSLAATADLEYHDRVHEGDTTSGEDRTSGSPAHPQSFEAQQSRIEFGNGRGNDDVVSHERSSLAEQNGPARPQVLKSQKSKMDFGGGSSDDDEVIFVGFQERPSLSEQNSPASPQM